MNIKEVAKKTGISERNIRFYEKEGVIKIPRQENGYRYFTNDLLSDLILISNAKKFGFSIKDMSSLVTLLHAEKRESKNVHNIIKNKLDKISLEIESLQKSKEHLESLINKCQNNSSSECNILDVMSTDD